MRMIILFLKKNYRVTLHLKILQKITKLYPTKPLVVSLVLR